MKKIYELAQQLQFTPLIDYNDDRAYNVVKKGGYTFCFVIEYNRSIKCTYASDYLQPSEHDVSIEYKSVTDLEIYNVYGALIECSETEADIVLEIIENNLLNA